MSGDPLAGLLVDGEEIDRTRLASVLQELVAIDERSGEVVLKPGYNRLSSRQRILAYLLGRKASVLLGKSEAEAASPKTVASETGMPTGTVNPKLTELLADRLVQKTQGSEYYIAPALLSEAIGEMEKKEAK
jgi:hypothetical protein